MDFLKKLFSASPAKPTGNFLILHVKCDRCGEVIEGRVNMANDLSLTDGGDGYFVRKVLMGSGRCFQRIEVELTFDLNRKLLNKQSVGGVFIE